VVDGVKPKAEEAHRFKEESLKLDDRGSAKVPVVEIETPSALPAPPAGGFAQIAAPAAAPAAAEKRFEAAAVAAPVPEIESPAGELPKEEKRDEALGESFNPGREVFEKVDERIVEREKAAVRELVDAPDAEEFAKFVNVALSAASDGAWTYFKVMFSPRHELETVPKDFVVLIDASGSIGRERIKSIRSAAGNILRSAANSGDRFNLVAFRDRYSYAFRSWQECNGESFARADKWLSNVAAHGRTDVFATIRSVLTLPRAPERPLIALVVTDGEANSGVSSTAEILSRFTALNDGLISVYMYGVKSSANRELIDLLTRGNRGESFVYSGRKARSGSGIEGLSERFRDPVLSDIRVIFTAQSRAEAYPRRLRNLYRGGVLELYGRVPAGVKKVAFSLRGLNGKKPYTGFYSFDLSAAPVDSTAVAGWKDEKRIDLKLK
jgi:Mg-chelatase subunit ChlD